MTPLIQRGEAATRRIREKYLRAVLRQNVAYFDALGAGEVTTRIQVRFGLIPARSCLPTRRTDGYPLDPGGYQRQDPDDSDAAVYFRHWFRSVTFQRSYDHLRADFLYQSSLLFETGAWPSSLRPSVSADALQTMKPL